VFLNPMEKLLGLGLPSGQILTSRTQVRWVYRKMIDRQRVMIRLVMRQSHRRNQACYSDQTAAGLASDLMIAQLAVLPMAMSFGLAQRFRRSPARSFGQRLAVQAPGTVFEQVLVEAVEQV